VGGPAQAQSTSQPTSQPAPSSNTANYFKFPIKLQYEASYAELLRLTNRFQTFPRLLVIRRITMHPRGEMREVPELNSDMDVEMYVLPKEAR